MKIHFLIKYKRIRKILKTLVSNRVYLRLTINRDTFLYMFFVILTHSDNSMIVDLAWGQLSY